MSAQTTATAPGRSTTGDNGVKTASQKRREDAAAKLAAEARKQQDAKQDAKQTDTTPDTTPDVPATLEDAQALIAKLRADLAAEAVKTTKSPKTREPGKQDIQRVIASALVVCGAELVSNWKPADYKIGDLEISQETAREAVGRWLSYLPNCDWSPELGKRSNAGRPGGKAAGPRAS